MSKKRIIVRVPQWLGDAVVSTVFLKRLKAQQPEAHMIVACVASLAPLFETHPDVDEVMTLPYPTGTVFEAARVIAQGHADTAYILPRSFRAALESRLANIPERIGYSGDLRRALLTQAVRYDERLRYAHRYLKLIGEESLDLEQVRPHFPVATPANSAIASFFETRKPVLGVAPISIAPSRTWAPERFAAVANSFVKKSGGAAVLFGSAGEKARISAIAPQITSGDVLNTAGELSMAELGWCLSHCTAFLGNDSGLMHVAASFEVPSVILFGASEPKFALPPWGRSQAIQHADIFCVPCLKNNCVRFGEGHNECLKAISAEEASRALDAVVSRP